MGPKWRFAKNRKNLFFAKLHNWSTLTQPHWRVVYNHILSHIWCNWRIQIIWIVYNVWLDHFYKPQCIYPFHAMGGTYAGLHPVKEACWASPLSGREYISWLLFVCQPDMPLWLSFDQIMLTWENSTRWFLKYPESWHWFVCVLAPSRPNIKKIAK